MFADIPDENNSITDDGLFFLEDDTKNLNSTFFRKENEKARIFTVDVMRGTGVIFMILGQSQFFFPKEEIFEIFKFSEWDNLHVADFILPLFLFTMGACCYLSYLKNREEYKKYQLIAKISKKYIILLFCGIFFNWLLTNKPFSIETIFKLKITSYFFRIGICYFFISVINIFGIIYIIVFLFIIFFIYIYFIHFFEVDYCGNNTLSPHCNFARVADNFIFTKYHMQYPTDPFGLFSSINSMYTTFSGYLIIYIIKKEQNYQNDKHNMIIICGFGITNLALFFVFTFLFRIPINMTIYSSSFMLLCSGIFSLLFVGIYFITEFKKTTNIKRLFIPFECFGLNSLVLYSFIEITNGIMYQVNLAGIPLFKNNPKVRSLLYSFIIFIIEGSVAVLLYKKKLHFKI